MLWTIDASGNVGAYDLNEIITYGPYLLRAATGVAVVVDVLFIAAHGTLDIPAPGGADDPRAVVLEEIPAIVTCPWDLNNDNLVGTTDLLLLLGAWGSNPKGPPDFDGDGNVGTSDLIELLGNWGPCPK